RHRPAAGCRQGPSNAPPPDVAFTISSFEAFAARNATARSMCFAYRRFSPYSREETSVERERRRRLWQSCIDIVEYHRRRTVRFMVFISIIFLILNSENPR